MKEIKNPRDLPYGDYWGYCFTELGTVTMKQPNAYFYEDPVFGIVYVFVPAEINKEPEKEI